MFKWTSPSAQKKRADIPLSRDGSTRLLPWIIGFMVYIATLASAGALVLSSMSENWESSLSGALTIQIPAPADLDEDPRERTQDVLDLLEKTQGIASFETLESNDVISLLEPWLGLANDPADLPVPTLITVKMNDYDSINTDILLDSLKDIHPAISIDTHEIWRAQLVRVMQSLQLIAGFVVAVVSFAAITMIIFATRGGLATHRSIVELLHLIGAHDGYIAQQFQRHVFVTSLKGSIGGILLSIGTLAILHSLSQGLGKSLVPSDLISVTHWAVLAAIPAITILISVVTARQTVMVNLKRMT